MISVYKTGKVEFSNNIYKDIKTTLSERYKDVIKRQIDGMLKSYLSNRKNDFNDIIYRSSLTKEQKKELNIINYYSKWFEVENKLARKIFKQTFRKNALPDVGKINMLLNTKVFTLEESTDSSYKYWIKLCTENRGKFIYIPIKDNSYFNNQKGELTNSAQLNFKDNKLTSVVLSLTKEVDTSYQGFKKIGIDIGLKNLITTSEGDLYSKGFMTKISKYDVKIVKLQKELQKRNIKLKDNKRYTKLNSSLRGFIKNEANRVINNIVKTHKPKEIVSENLNFQNSSMNKRMNRLINKFGVGVINQKLMNLNEEKKIKNTKINPAYTSLECSNCHYIDKRNRNGEQFKCLCCGKTQHADINSTKNIIRRSNDNRIDIYTNKNKILQLLADDFVNSKWFCPSSLSSALFKKNKYYNVYDSSAMSLFSIK
jgi:putative transposase